MDGPSGSRRYFGKYRGTVITNVDPMQMGRIMAMVPDALGTTPSTWAMPCVPVAGLQTGFYAMPPIGAGVWVEFEQGNIDYPIWVGCYWGSGSEVPPLAQTVPPAMSGFTMQTTLQNGLVISDLSGPSGGIMLKSAAGSTIIVNDTGIYIQNSQGASIELSGPTVTINQGAMAIT